MLNDLIDLITWAKLSFSQFDLTVAKLAFMYHFSTSADARFFNMGMTAMVDILS